MCPAAKLDVAQRSEALVALQVAANAALRLRPTIELCVKAKLGAPLANVSVNTLDAPREKDAAQGGAGAEAGGCFRPQVTLSTQSRRSVARMLRLLCAPVAYSSTSKNSTNANSEKGAVTEADEHLDATHVTVASAPTVKSSSSSFTAHSGSPSHRKTTKTAPRLAQLRGGEGGGGGSVVGGGGGGGGGGGVLVGRFGKLTNFALLAGAPPKKKARVFSRF